MSAELEVTNNIEEERPTSLLNTEEVEFRMPEFIEDPEKILAATWGPLAGKDLERSINKIYLKVTRWKRNLFYLPTGKAGENIIDELTRIFDLCSGGSPFEPVALTMAVIIFPLLLQKPSRDSKTVDHVRFVEKMMTMWKHGDLDGMLSEGRAIQKKDSLTEEIKSSQQRVEIH